MRTTIVDVQQMKDRGERIPMVTAYDYTSAQLIDMAGLPLILVGDTLGMVMLGYSTTVPVTMDEMLHHARAVVRGSSSALVVGDLPFLTYATLDAAIRNAGRMLQEGGVQAVKLEGGTEVAETVRMLVRLGIPVMGHIGLTPQSVNQLGGMRVQGKRARAAARLIRDAQALEDAGAFAIVLELVPAQLSAEISRRLRIPTIGIGAGAGTDGQVQVWHDMLGLYADFLPRHARRYALIGDAIVAGLTQYRDDVRHGTFPSAEHAVSMREGELQATLQELDEPGTE